MNLGVWACIVFAVFLLWAFGAFSEIANAFRHGHIYHVVHSEFKDGVYIYHRDTYDFCIRCGKDKPEGYVEDGLWHVEEKPIDNQVSS